MSVINTNITAMIGQQNLASSKADLTTAMERLSSGLRINSAKDDAAGQAIANRMTAQTNGLAQAQRNANDGISLAQTAEGALNQMNDNTQRIRELVVQAANGTNSAADLTSIQDEIDERVSEITRLSDETKFNDLAVLDGDAATGINIQVGAEDGQTIGITIAATDSTTLGNANIALSDLNVTTADFTDAGTTATSGGSYLGAIDDALAEIDSTRSNLGAVQNRFESAITNLQTTETNLSAARSRIEDADYATEVSNMTRAQILQQAGTSVLAQANQVPQGVLSLLG